MDLFYNTEQQEQQPYMNYYNSCPIIPPDIVQFAYCYPRHLLDLCTMHLSLVLDISADHLFSETKLPRTNTVSKLTKLFSSRSPDEDSLELNDALMENLGVLMNFLEKEENLKTEGIFRKSGNFARQKDLRSLLISDTSLNHSVSQDSISENFQPAIIQTDHLKQHGVHQVASAFKKILSQLSESLLTSKLTDLFLQIPQSFSDVEQASVTSSVSKNFQNLDKSIRVAQILVFLLPPRNRLLLHRLLTLLNNVSTQAHLNKMATEALATVFAPILVPDIKTTSKDLKKKIVLYKKLVIFLIENFRQIFQISEALLHDIRLNSTHLSLYEDEFEAPLITNINFTDRNIHHSLSQTDLRPCPSPIKSHIGQRRLLSSSRPFSTLNLRSCDDKNDLFARGIYGVGCVDMSVPYSQLHTEETNRQIVDLYNHVKSLPESTKNRQRFFKRLRKFSNSKENSSSPDFYQTKIINFSIKKRFTRSSSKLPQIPVDCEQTRLISWNDNKDFDSPVAKRCAHSTSNLPQIPTYQDTKRPVNLRRGVAFVHRRISARRKHLKETLL